MPFYRRCLLLRLLLWCFFCFRRYHSCGVEHDQLHEERRRQLQQMEGSEAPTEVPYNPHLLFNGNLINDRGETVKDAQIQFWHADYHGNYFHPEDDMEGKELMKETFSYFGTASTNADGNFDFKTYRPGIYTARPVTHIHFKVFYNGTELLTSQFYFEDEGVRRWYDDMVILRLEEDTDEDGNVVLTTDKQVVVNMRMGGYTKLTPRDVEGPFYPLVDFFDVGNDMTSGLLTKFYPSDAPTMAISVSPTQEPTKRPTRGPTNEPTSMPFQKLSTAPSSIENVEDLPDSIDAEKVTSDGKHTWDFEAAEDEEINLEDFQEHHNTTTNTSSGNEEKEPIDNNNTTAIHNDGEGSTEVWFSNDYGFDNEGDGDNTDVFTSNDNEELLFTDGISATAAVDLPPTSTTRIPEATNDSDTKTLSSKELELSAFLNENGSPAFPSFGWPWTPESVALYDKHKRPITERLPALLPSDEETKQDDLTSEAVDVTLSRAIKLDKSSEDRDEDENAQGKGPNLGSSDGKRFLRRNT